VIEPGGRSGIRGDDGYPARRSAVVLGGTRIAFARAEICSLPALEAALLRAPRLFGAPAVERALDLDGGPSSTLGVTTGLGQDGSRQILAETGPLVTVVLLRARDGLEAAAC